MIRTTSIDHRPELDDLRKQLTIKVGKLELAQTLKANTAVIEELGKENKHARDRLDELTAEME